MLCVLSAHFYRMLSVQCAEMHDSVKLSVLIVFLFSLRSTGFDG